MILGLILAWLLTTLALALVARRFPRSPVKDPPDWGRVEDWCLPLADGGFLEAFRVDPEEKACGTVVLAHGWSRNRDRMTPRARVFGKLGFRTVMASARDHGASSPHPKMDTAGFADDLSAVLDFVGEPVVLYGHSAGSAAAVAVAARRPDQVRGLVLESAFVDNRAALLRFYWSFHPLPGLLLSPGVIFWMELLSLGRFNKNAPGRLAAGVACPVLLIHGDRDRRFPAAWSQTLAGRFSDGRAAFRPIHGAGHSNAPDFQEFEPAIKAFVERNRENFSCGNEPETLP